MAIAALLMIILLFTIGIASILYSIIYPKDFMPAQYVQEKPKKISVEIEYMFHNVDEDLEINDDILE